MPHLVKVGINSSYTFQHPWLLLISCDHVIGDDTPRKGILFK